MSGDVLFQTTENCLTMAAGSDPQPVESSVVPEHSKSGLVPSTSLPRISSVRNHIPYSDHNYGKPLTPPNSCSPEHPEEADTGNEEEGFTRCICGFKHDDGYMICCDKCSAWQHVECVGIKSNSVPETYLCDECDPRPLDKERAKQIQTKKIEEPTDEEEEEDGDVSDRESDNGLPQVTLPNPVSIKENILTKGKRKKRDSTRKLAQKEIKHSKRKRRKRKHISTNAIPVDEDTNGPWNLSSFPGFNKDQYQEALKTVYIGDLDKQSFPMSELRMNLPSLLKSEQLCKVVEVQKNRKGVVVTEDTGGEQFIIECKGNLMLESKFKEDNPLPKSCPFVLHYTKLDHLRLVMNFATYGNDARFIRRSCSPTAEVRHVTVDSQIHLVVVSINPLPKGTEVTVGFEFPFHEYRRQLECACAQDNCMVLKHNSALESIEQTNGYRKKEEHGLALIESSLSNQMDSDSEGDNSNEGKGKRSRKKLSREERKLQAYLRQIEKMEKTEKKRQQSNGRDTRTGILTQRNYGDEYNTETPTKPGKGFRKQGISHRHQHKMQSLARQTHRLPSCSSEPLSPDDNSSATSTPTTPSVNVVEEQNEVHNQDTSEKSFKFPKFKKGSLNDVSTSSGDPTRSNNASPEAGYASPSKSSFEERLVEVEVSDPAVPSCDRLANLEQTLNGSTSPRTDPNTSPSPCQSTSASPTRSESVDLSDVTTRHCSASPPAASLASYLLSQKQNKSSQLHTTLKKRWLLKYMNEHPVDKRLNGIVSANSIKRSEVVKTTSERTFPLPYKRRKLMEYRNAVNNQTLSITKEVDSQTVGSTAAVSVSTIISTLSSTLVTPIISNAVTSVTSDVRDSLYSSSQSCSPISRNNGGCDETSTERSSLSSISSTEDVRTGTTFLETKIETQSNGMVDSSTGCSSTVSVPKPISSDKLSSTQGIQGRALEVNMNCLTRSDDHVSRDSISHVMSSVDGPRHASTIGGKKKVSLTEYLSRKRTSTGTVKKESSPSRSSDVSSPSQSRVSEVVSGPSGIDLMSSEVNCKLVVGSSNTLRTMSSSVSSSTGGAFIEPVSSDDGDVDDDRAVLHTTSQDLRTAPVIREAKPSVGRESYFNSSLTCSGNIISEPGSSSDAMDIEEDEAPSSSTILVNTPVMSGPGGTSRSELTQGAANSLMKPYYSTQNQIKLDNITSGQTTIARQITDSLVPPDSLRRRPGLVPTNRILNPSIQAPSRCQDFHSTGSQPPPFC